MLTLMQRMKDAPRSSWRSDSYSGGVLLWMYACMYAYIMYVWYAWMGMGDMMRWFVEVVRGEMSWRFDWRLKELTWGGDLREMK